LTTSPRSGPYPDQGPTAGGRGPGRGVGFAFLVLFLCMLVPQPSAGEEKRPAPSPARAINQDVLRGIEMLYDLEFDEAERIFSRIVSEKPKKPVGYFYMAMVSWSRLSIGSWTSETLKEYLDRIDLTISVARKRVENQEADSFDYFYLGGALGFKGRFELMRHNWFSSYLLAYEAIEALRKCAKRDPSNVDVLLGLGLYDYYTARLSGVVKFLSYLFLYKGDKDEGLRKLKTAADKAVYSAIESKSMLLHIYLFMEEDFYKALPFARELAGKFRKNPRNKYFEGIVYIRGGQDARYAEVLDFIRAESGKQGSKAKAQMWANQALYLEASYHLFRNQPEHARAKLDAILSTADPITDPAMVAWPLLKKGMSYDLEGKRDRALEIYRSVINMENGAGAQFLAEKNIDEAVKKGDPFLGY
jgi:tetratricopeptide (TPR) repeat protein